MDRRDVARLHRHVQLLLAKLTTFERMVALSEIVGGSSAVVDMERRVPGFGLVVTVAA